MDITLREWMIVIGGLLILAVIVDGIRRMRLERKNAIRLSKKARRPIPEEVSANLRNPELPGGGRSRVRSREDFDPLLDDIVEDDSEPSVPVLMDSVDAEPEIDSDTPGAEDESVPGPAQEELFADDDEAVGETTEPEPASDVIVINLKDSSGNGIPGGRLLELLLACDVRFGEMDIFHRHAQGPDARRQPLFSVANLLEPGTFDVDNMDEFKTPGVCLFMRLPGPAEPLEAFRLMLDTAEVLASNLDAELYDDQHCRLRQQSLEHMRDRVEEFERRKLLGA